LRRFVFAQPGDVALMVGDSAALTGVGKSLLVKTVTPGAFATSNALALSWDIPADNGGFAVSSYVVQWATANTFASPADSTVTFNVSDSLLLFQTQVISLYGGTLPGTVVTSGTWQLSYSSVGNSGGARTSNLQYVCPLAAATFQQPSVTAAKSALRYAHHA
jgi:hypothetical protein